MWREGKFPVANIFMPQMNIAESYLFGVRLPWLLVSLLMASVLDSCSCVGFGLYQDEYKII
jgi:hypothetical protein